MLREGKRHIVKGMRRFSEHLRRKGSAMFHIRGGEIKAKGGNLGLTGGALPTQRGKPATEEGCPRGRIGRLSVRIVVLHRLVSDCVGGAGAAVDVEGADLGGVERASAAT